MEVSTFIAEVAPDVAVIAAIPQMQEGRESLSADMSLQPAPAMGIGVLLADDHKLSDRILQKRAQKAIEAVKGMAESQRDLVEGTEAYNSMALVEDPALFAEINAFAATQKVAVPGAKPRPMSPEEALAQVLDTRFTNPALEPMRRRMATLSEKPAFLKARTKIAETAHRYIKNTDYLSEIYKTAGRPRTPNEAAGAQVALGRLSVAMDKHFNMEAALLRADVPSTSPQVVMRAVTEPVAQMKGAMDKLVTNIENDFKETFGTKGAG